MKRSKTFNERLSRLGAEVEVNYPGLVGSLERGLRVVVVTEPFSELDFDPEAIQKAGEVAMLCRHYGAIAVFLDQECVGKPNGEGPEFLRVHYWS